MILATFPTVIFTYTSTFDDFVSTHIVAPDIDAERVDRAILAVLDRVGPDEVVAAADVVAECVRAHLRRIALVGARSRAVICNCDASLYSHNK